MSKTIKPIQLSDAIQEVLDKYKDEVADAIDDAADDSAKFCVKEVKANSRVFTTHENRRNYAKGWTKKQTQFGRGSKRYTIHNKTAGLPHLLEYGHALRQGGSTGARPHIAPAEQSAIEYFEKKAKEAIENASV